MSSGVSTSARVRRLAFYTSALGRPAFARFGSQGVRSYTSRTILFTGLAKRYLTGLALASPRQYLEARMRGSPSGEGVKLGGRSWLTSPGRQASRRALTGFLRCLRLRTLRHRARDGMEVTGRRENSQGELIRPRA